MLGRCKCTLFLFLAFAGTISAQRTSPATTYRDSVYPFVITYPSTWKRNESPDSRTRLEVASDSGQGLANFTIAVTPAKGSEKTASATFVKLFLDDRPEMLEAIPRSILRNSKITASGRTFLGNQDAFYLIFEGEHRSLDETIELKMYLLEMLFEGNVYALTFGTTKNSFDANLPVFRDIALSFGVIPTKISVPRK